MQFVKGRPTYKLLPGTVGESFAIAVAERLELPRPVIIMSGRTVVYVLHGHGTGGVLKSKIRGWLKSERQLVKRWAPAAQADGGDAFTLLEVR